MEPVSSNSLEQYEELREYKYVTSDISAKAAMTYIPTSDLAQNRWEPSSSIILGQAER